MDGITAKISEFQSKSNQKTESEKEHSSKRKRQPQGISGIGSPLQPEYGDTMIHHEQFRPRGAKDRVPPLNLDQSLIGGGRHKRTRFDQ